MKEAPGEPYGHPRPRAHHLLPQRAVFSGPSGRAAIRRNAASVPGASS
ncbi:hypothetical protein [Streptomyces sp. NPDC001530]